MHDDADIIEISSQASSPLPELFLPTHSRPKGRGNATRSSTKGKGKGKMKQQDVEVIELTDSSDKDKDDEDDEIQVIQARSLSKSLKSQWTIVFDDEDAGDEPSRVRPHGAEAGPSRVNGIGDSQAEPDTGSVENTQVKGRVSNEFQAVGLGDDRDVLEWFSGNLGDSLEPPQPEVQPPPHSPSPSASPASVSGSSFSNVNGLEPGAHPPPVPLPPPPLLESPEETMSRYVAQILEIVPDVDPEHCSSLIADHVHLSDATVERILHILFEDPGYPRKRKDKGKRKADGGAEGSVPSNKKVKENGRGQGRVAGDHGDDLWISVERPFLGGINYHQLALNILQADYPYIPKTYIRARLSFCKGFYAPTFFFLRQLDEQIKSGLISREDYPYQPKKTPYKPTQGKGKEKERVLEDVEFENELAWVKKRIAGGTANANTNHDAGEAEDEDDSDDVADPNESDGEDEENGIECGCCFSKYRFEKMSQCPDAHLFCLSCLRSYASGLLGSHNPHISCMSQTSCSLLFTPDQLRRVLPRKTYALYERLVQQKEITEAGLEGLEECPFCEWKCVMDVDFEGEKLFRCGNEEGGCGVTSCRKCKKLDHLPKSCEEVEADKKLDARHLVEEAMTQALMRNCPKCKKAFIKESGCNKMTCPNCRTASCYICRQIITGYEHFDQRRSTGNTPISSSKGTKKCVLWDKDLDAMHANEVKLAADQALAEARFMHPDVPIVDFKVDLPAASSSKTDTHKAGVRRGRYGMAEMPLPFFNGLGVPGPPPLQRGAGQRRRGGHHLANVDANVVGGAGAVGGPGMPPPAALQHVHYHIHQLAAPAPAPLQQQPLPIQMHHHHHHHHHPPPLYHQHRRQQIPDAQVEQPLNLPFREAVAQAMRGRYQPLDGGMEICGRVLRARGGRGRVEAQGVDEAAEGVGLDGVQVPPRLRVQEPAPRKEAGAGGRGVNDAVGPEEERQRHRQEVNRLLLRLQQQREEQMRQLNEHNILRRQREQQEREREQQQQGELRHRLLIENQRFRERRRAREGHEREGERIQEKDGGGRRFFRLHQFDDDRGGGEPVGAPLGQVQQQQPEREQQQAVAGQKRKRAPGA